MSDSDHQLCDICLSPDHDAAHCPSFLAAREGPVTLDLDPYETYTSAHKVGMRQLELAEGQNTVFQKMMVLMESQTQELRALRADVGRLKALGPGGRAPRALAAPKFCRFCGGPLRECQPTCVVHGNENEP